MQVVLRIVVTHFTACVAQTNNSTVVKSISFVHICCRVQLDQSKPGKTICSNEKEMKAVIGMPLGPDFFVNISPNILIDKFQILNH